MPILAAFAVTLAHFVALYRLRVAARPAQMLGAVLAAMAVQWTVARAVGCGLWSESLPFMRTAKGGATRKGPEFPAFWEAVLAVLLIAGAAPSSPPTTSRSHEINMFALVLVVQSLPFLAAVALAVIEGTRFNEFAYWRRVQTRVAAVLSRSAAPVGVKRRQGPHARRVTAHVGRLPRRRMRLSRSPTPRARFRPASPNRTSRTGSPRR